jgi:hypothetical protein
MRKSLNGFIRFGIRYAVFCLFYWIGVVVPEASRGDVIAEAAERLRVRPVIVEKDFWVCWLLGLLFEETEWREDREGTWNLRALAVHAKSVKGADVLNPNP